VMCISNFPTPHLAGQARALIEAHCQSWCQQFGLAQVYLVYALGRRRHFVAGYGQPVIARPQQMSLGGQFFLCWHGLLQTAEQEILVKDAEAMLAACFPNDNQGCHCTSPVHTDG